LIGVGLQAGLQVKAAAAVAPIPVTVHNDIGAFHGTDDEYLKYFNVPGIQMAGGLLK
jgi:hypothetical protein